MGLLYKMDQEFKNHLIKLAWSDRVSFEEIEKRTGLREAEVIKVMRGSLKRSRFRVWRKRVSGRKTKHAHIFKKDQRLRQKRKYRVAEFDKEDYILND